MASQDEIEHRVMDIIVHAPGCDLDDVLVKCPDLTWNQVFDELDRLSRARRVVLKQTGRGHYAITPTRSNEQRVPHVH
jgi:hypothetical protein